MALETVGCRLNQYETEKIAGWLVAAGMERVGYKDRADLYILNSCTVTGRADADCRKLINRARRQNEQAVVVVTGCYVESRPDQIADLNAADLTIGNDEKDRLPEIIRAAYPHLFESVPSLDHQRRAKDILPELKTAEAKAPASPNRAMVKIGDGCNQNCSYCIVPKVRGRLVSNPADDIVDEVRRLVDDGYHEVVLTAVHIGKYHYKDLNLAGLVGKIMDETDLARLRLSSLEPNELDQALLDLVVNSPRVCRHLHLPLQSGSDRILKLMRRPYGRDDYLELIGKIKKLNPNITIGCDLIVGFPGESDKDFRQSLDMLESGHVDYAHVFSYSDRPGTAASELPDKIKPGIIKERNRIAREIGENNRHRQMASQTGQVLGVISEHVSHGRDGYNAISDNYLRVRLPRRIGGGRHIIRVHIDKLVGDRLEGEADTD